MVTLARRVRRVFLQAWRRYGRPVMAVIRPVNQWGLPPGYAYDESLDAVIYGDTGDVLPNPEDYWASDYIYIVPAREAADMRALVAAGIVPEGITEVFILADDAPTVRAAHAIEIDGQWYDVISVDHAPAGTGGVWARVQLRRRS
ncbi:MAG TPA: hypothetical protein G4O02_13335 [Caldilineae bacterium]|nr:hypothetical protein [Caldilineae bacterium]